MIKLTVKGRPVPKARPVVPKKGRPYTRKSTLKYEQKVREAYRASSNPAYMAGEALSADLRFYFKVPKNTTKKQWAELIQHPWYTKKKDLDNLAKSVLDALNGVAYADDSQIACLYLSKVYDISSKGERVEIYIGRM